MTSLTRANHLHQLWWSSGIPNRPLWHVWEWIINAILEQALLHCQFDTCFITISEKKTSMGPPISGLFDPDIVKLLSSVPSIISFSHHLRHPHWRSGLQQIVIFDYDDRLLIRVKPSSSIPRLHKPWTSFRAYLYCMIKPHHCSIQPSTTRGRYLIGRNLVWRMWARVLIVLPHSTRPKPITNANTSSAIWFK